MGRYLNTNACTSSVGRSYCRIRYLLRKHPHLAKEPPGLDLHTYSLLPCPSTSAKKPVNYRDRGANLLPNFTKDVTRLQDVRFYSSSNRNVFKAEAPIGILEEVQNKSQANSLGERLGQSFIRLSTHINLYFQQKDVVPLTENGPSVVTTPDPVGRSQRRCQSQRPARERNQPESKDSSQTSEDKQESCGAAIQLFHISSLTTRFGESYTYVANHINSVFSVGSEKVEPATKAAHRRPKRRRTHNSFLINSKLDEIAQVKSNADQTSTEPHNTPTSWEESCRHFARHINKYFAAKVTDGHRSMRESTNKNYFSTQDALQVQGGMSRLNPRPDSGLFHNSNSTTFGENHLQTSRHINQYFGLDEDGNRSVSGSGAPGEPRTVSFMDCLRHPASAIPDLVGSYLKWGPSSQTGGPKAAVTPPETILNKRRVMNWRQTEEVTRGLILSLGQAPSPEALTASVEALNEHLICYPSRKALMWQERTIVTLLKCRRACRDNQQLQSAIRETLALIGYVDPVKGRGIRVLSIDGGGTRGVVPLQVLKHLEAETGKKIHQLFDYICGVSTGAVLAFMLGLAHFSLEECADMYRRFGSEVFRQNPLVGTMKMGWSHSYYNTETWETILREKLGDRVLIKTARDELSPKVSAVSAVVNWGTSPKAFVFCNYNHKPGSLSRYAGACGYQMWQAVRASSAAPGYFQEFPLQSDIHQDGGIIMNNPCALAVHESRLLWPKQPFQCVLSLGTGRYDNAKRAPATSTSLRAKISNLICSATDTEGVHTLLDDLLAPDVYFRFNPMLSAEVSLDESRQGALAQLERDTQLYLERNRPKLARLCLVLGAERSAVSRTLDWISERVWEMKQGWV